MPSQDMLLTQEEQEDLNSATDVDEPEDSLPTQDEPLTQEEQEEEGDGMDDYGPPEARERTTPEEAARDPHAAMDHLSASQHGGKNGNNAAAGDENNTGREEEQGEDRAPQNNGNDEHEANANPSNPGENERQRKEPEDSTGNENEEENTTFEPPDLDEFGLPKGRPRASVHELQLDPLAAFDHFDMAQCLGFEGASFHTAQRIDKCQQIPWACAFGYACSELNNALLLPTIDPNRSEIMLERRVKLYNVLAILFLRKPPSENGTRAKDLQSIICRRLSQFNARNWWTILSEIS